MKAVFTSFHSASPIYISEYYPDTIVTFDSHLDLYFSSGFTGILRELIVRLPEHHMFIFLRPSAHILLREQCPEAEYYLVIPKERFKYEILPKLRKSLH